MPTPLTPNSFINIWSLKGRILVIAEKPKASKRIAYALSDNPIVHKYKKIQYYEIRSSFSTIIVASAAGHLYELHTELPGYPVFTYEWVPAYLVNSEKQHTKEYLELLEKLSKGCDYYINACDYDIEGSVIGYLIIKLLGNEKRAYRAKFSSLVPSELKAAFSKLLPLDYNMVEAGLCRHELDWIWGINISRALMKAVQGATGSKTVLSVGRVQTPTLKYVVEKTLERKLFIPLPQYSITLLLKKNGTVITASYVKNPVSSREEAEKVAQVVRKHGYLVVKDVSKSLLKYTPPPPFNLSDLQEEAARIYGLSPMETQNIAEQLYLDALISYPRTNSQKLPPNLNYREILARLSSIGEYSKLVSDLLSETRGVLKPVEGEKEDPAHPAIYPTGTLPKSLTKKQRAVYDLIVRRFLAAFAPPAHVAYIKATLSTPGNECVFEASGLFIESTGWFKYYPFHRPESKHLPPLNRGEVLEVVNTRLRESYTKPPPRLKKIDVLRWMEEVGIGTESTRALIIEKLFDRRYLVSAKTGISVTDLGYGVIEVVDIFFPDLASVELTRTFESMINDVMKGVRRREEVVNSAKEVIKKLVSRFDNHAPEVGLILARRMGISSNYTKCSIPSCRREAHVDGLCKYHYQALKRVHEAYSEWKTRKRVSFDEYVLTLLRLKSTGDYVKEVITHVIRKA